MILVPTIAMLTLPLFILLTMAAAMGVGTWFAALNVNIDVRHAIPSLTQVWMFVTPAVYPAAFAGESWRTLYARTPMVGVVEGFRWAIWAPAMLQAAYRADVSRSDVGVVIFRAYFFRRAERTFADMARTMADTAIRVEGLGNNTKLEHPRRVTADSANGWLMAVSDFSGSFKGDIAREAMTAKPK